MRNRQASIVCSSKIVVFRMVGYSPTSVEMANAGMLIGTCTLAMTTQHGERGKCTSERIIRVQQYREHQSNKSEDILEPSMLLPIQ
jgi:hypothetical protein